MAKAVILLSVLMGAAGMVRPAAAAHEAVPHVAMQSYLDSGKSGSVLHAGDNLASAMRIRCTGNPTCALAMIVADHVCNQVGLGTVFEIKVAVDDTQVGDGEWLTLMGTSNGACAGGTWSEIFVVGPGDHTIKLYTVIPPSTLYAQTQGRWPADYTVNVP